MDQLLAHLVGDFCLQNHWMAMVKKQKLWVALLHAMTYTLPFMAITQHPTALLTICLTHAVIDRYSLAVWWCKFYGVGRPGWIWLKLHGQPVTAETNAVTAPDYLNTWLTIIVDNTIHLLVNYGCLTLCPYLHWSPN